VVVCALVVLCGCCSLWGLTENAGHEIDGHEIDGHEIGGQDIYHFKIKNIIVLLGCLHTKRNMKQ